jgi:DNA-binding MarR family transcriptional regulator
MSKETLLFGQILLKTMLAVRNKLEQSLQDEGFADISFDKVALLKVLTVKDEMIQQDLADVMKRHKSTVLRTIDGLEKKKLVARVPDSADRRKNTVVLTKAGQELVKKFDAIEKKVNDKIVKGFTASELKTFEAHLKRIHDVLKE